MEKGSWGGGKEYWKIVVKSGRIFSQKKQANFANIPLLS
jgi:hypothetical protein